MPENWKGGVLRAIAGADGGAPAAAVYDGAADMRLVYNGGRLVPAGLMAALPALWNLFERVEAGEFALEDALPGASMTWEEAARAVCGGGVEAANALIGVLGTEAVNAAARRAGMEQTEILRPVGENESLRGNVTCAEDAAGFFRRLLDREGLPDASCRRLLALMSESRSDDKFASVGGKCLARFGASFPGSEYDAGVLCPDGQRPVIAAALVMLQPDREKGERFCRRVAEAVCGERMQA